MRLATEEIICTRYMLRSLGIPITEPSKIARDNAGVVINAFTPDAVLKKKHVALSFHCVRENVATGVIGPVRIDGKDNMADILMKATDRTTFMRHVNKVLLHGTMYDKGEEQ
jgi:hypothetical protein